MVEEVDCGGAEQSRAEQSRAERSGAECLEG